MAPKPKGPVWKGPAEEGGGITFSLLSRYLVCKERFRIMVIEGLRPQEVFEPKLEYGQMWHCCEEEHAKDSGRWQIKLVEYGKSLCKRFSTQQELINHWYHVARTAFPLYTEHWKKHPDVKEREPMMQEEIFNVLYRLPSQRLIRLRGKWDSVDLIGKGKERGIYLQENKSKSSIDPQKIGRQTTFDLQTMLYLVALTECIERLEPKWKRYAGLIRGVRYNVVRRSAHKQGKNESMAEFCERLSGIINASPSEWFARWKIEVTPADIKKFVWETLDPILENVIDDWEWWKLCKEDGQDPFNYGVRQDLFPEHRQRHYRHPFGVYNVLDEGGASDLDRYLETGSEAGLQRITNLFPELS